MRSHSDLRGTLEDLLLAREQALLEQLDRHGREVPQGGELLLGMVSRDTIDGAQRADAFSPKARSAVLQHKSG